MPPSVGPALNNRLILALATDQTALTATTATTLLTGTITTTGNALLIQGAGTVSNSTSTAINKLQVTIGGTVFAKGGTSQDGGLGSTPSLPQGIPLLGMTTALTAGTYTVNVQYSVSAGTMSIRGATGTNNEALIVLIQELTV